MSIYGELVQVQHRLNAQKENQAREGFDLLRLRSSGAGQLVSNELHAFANPFVFKPDISYGSEVITPPDLDNYEYPRCTGSVLRWERNARGFYIGAYLYVDVQCSLAEGGVANEPPSAVVEHYFQFSSLSYKALGGTANAAVQDESLPTLTPGF